jgi:uncharacterized phage protein (TIGR02218 family)
LLLLPGAATLHLARENRRLTIAGYVEKADGTVIRCTQHDIDLEISGGDFAGIYFSSASITASDIKSNSDLSVDNMEVSGAISDGFAITGFSVADIEAGQFDNAPFETFLCQWDDPSAWQKPLRRGYLGEISRTAEGSFQCEWRGIIQALHQVQGRTYGERCDVKRFGDTRCKFDVAAITQTATVTSVTSRRRFDVSISGGPHVAGTFELGEVIFTSGLNTGYLKQIKRDAVAGNVGELELWDSLPLTVTVGDELTIRPGCDRLFATCQAYENYKNFRGHGRWIPGIPNIIRAP